MQESISNQHFKNLLSIAVADGILDKSELEFIFKRTGKYFLTVQEIENIDLNAIHVQPLIIKDEKERAQKMLDLIELMYLDGEAHERERRLCMMFGVSMGFPADKMEELVDSVALMLNSKAPKKKVLENIKNCN
jgi:hypothetical protein